MKIMKSTEDYLEAMLMLKEERGYIRSVDIAQKLGVTKPSVSYATRRLRENDLIIMDVDGHILLTKTGMDIASRIYERHRVLTELFISLGVDPTTAREDACRVEHDLSNVTFEALCRLVETFEKDAPKKRPVKKVPTQKTQKKGDPENGKA